MGKFPAVGTHREIPTVASADCGEYLAGNRCLRRNGSLVVKADIPGLEAKDIEVTLTEDGITISGERREEKEVKEKDYYRCERSYGSFARQIALPAGADRDKAEATFKDGVLEVSFPLKEEAKQKRIEIKGS